MQRYTNENFVRCHENRMYFKSYIYTNIGTQLTLSCCSSSIYCMYKQSLDQLPPCGYTLQKYRTGRHWSNTLDDTMTTIRFTGGSTILQIHSHSVVSHWTADSCHDFTAVGALVVLPPCCLAQAVLPPFPTPPPLPTPPLLTPRSKLRPAVSGGGGGGGWRGFHYSALNMIISVDK